MMGSSPPAASMRGPSAPMFSQVERDAVSVQVSPRQPRPRAHSASISASDRAPRTAPPEQMSRSPVRRAATAALARRRLTGPALGPASAYPRTTTILLLSSSTPYAISQQSYVTALRVLAYDPWRQGEPLTASESTYAPWGPALYRPYPHYLHMFRSFQ